MSHRSCICLLSCTLRCIGILLLAMLAAGCAPVVNMKLLVKMIPDQEAFVRTEIANQFGKSEHAQVDVVPFGNVDSIEYELDKAAGSAGLVKVPFDKAAVLVANNKLLPLNAILTPNELSEFRSTYLLTSLGTYDNNMYYIPRKFETRIMVYSKSKVEEALAVWRQYRDSISLGLKLVNGYGLPAAYMLEDDPNKWDFYDVYAVGWIWAHTPYSGRIGARIAHRGKRYSGTSLRVIDRVFQCGGDSANVLTMAGDAAVDAFHWEALYASSGIYNKKMWEEGWSGTQIWQGFKDGEVFLAFMTQLDCFFIHGTGRDGLTGYLPNPDDMGVAIMPQGCSVVLDKNGDPVRMGSHAVTTGGWWWGIPKTTPNPRLSYQLAQFITSTKNQIQECSRFGMIPVRKDILSEMSMMFGGGWITQIYEVSFRQLMENKQATIPGNIRFNQISDLYLDAWFDIVVRGNWSAAGIIPDREYIAGLLASKYSPRAKNWAGLR